MPCFLGKHIMEEQKCTRDEGGSHQPDKMETSVGAPCCGIRLSRWASGKEWVERRKRLKNRYRNLAKRWEKVKLLVARLQKKTKRRGHCLGGEREGCHTDPGHLGGQPSRRQLGEWRIQVCLRGQLQNRERPAQVIGCGGERTHSVDRTEVVRLTHHQRAQQDGGHMGKQRDGRGGQKSSVPKKEVGG